MKPLKYLDYILNPLDLLRTKKVLQVNPTAVPLRTEPEEIIITVFEYDKVNVAKHSLTKIEEVYPFLQSPSITWINIDGLRKDSVENVCNHFGIHPLIAEDILSIGQRPKMDEIDGLMYCLLNMLSFNEKISLVIIIVAIFLVGLYPQPLLHIAQDSVSLLLSRYK